MATGKHLLLDVSVIIDLWCGTNAARESEQLIDEAVASGVQIWVAASSMATLDYVGRQALKRQGYPHEDVKDLVAALMENLMSFASVLSCHGFEQQTIYNQARDFEDAQIAAAARSLPGADLCLVTEDATFDHLGEISAVAPAQALKWLRENRLKAAGIPSVAYYTTPLHLQGAFQNLGHQPGDFPVAEQVAARCLSLPMSPYLSEGDQEKIANTLKGAG